MNLSTTLLLASSDASGFENFMSIVSKPDNIPIVAMLFIVVYFFGLSMKMARENDRLTMSGEKEKIYDRMNRWVWGETDEKSDSGDTKNV